MMVHVRRALAGICLVAVGDAPAQALNTRTWISGAGVDQAGCGPIATPCRSLQYAHDNTAAGGEIDVKDSAGYGSVIITRAISIVGDGSLAGVLASPGGNAITVNAGATDTVILRGLTVEGAGAGLNGLVLNTAGKLDVTNCVFQNFGGAPPDGNGILLQHATGSPKIGIVDTTSSYNVNAGILYDVRTTVTATIGIHRSTLAGNGDSGLVVRGSSSVGPVIAVTDTLSARNSRDGFNLDSVGLKVEIDQTIAADNVRHGFFIGSSAGAVIGRSSALGNGQFGLAAVLSGSNLFSFRNNQFFNNGSGATSGTIGTATLQ